MRAFVCLRGSRVRVRAHRCDLSPRFSLRSLVGRSRERTRMANVILIDCCGNIYAHASGLSGLWREVVHRILCRVVLIGFGRACVRVRSAHDIVLTEAARNSSRNGYCIFRQPPPVGTVRLELLKCVHSKNPRECHSKNSIWLHIRGSRFISSIPHVNILYTSIYIL